MPAGSSPSRHSRRRRSSGTELVGITKEWYRELACNRLTDSTHALVGFEALKPGLVIPAPSVNNGMNPAPADKVPGTPPPVSDPHDGVSMGRAYIVHARNEQEGLRFERYYATHRGGCSVWTVANQTLLSMGARKVDQLDLQCEDNKDQTSMFCDVTSFMGKN